MNKDLKIYFGICVWFLFIVIVVFLILNSILSTADKVWLDGNAWATIIIGAVSSACTIFLGFLSYWQNKNQRQDYLKKIEKLEAKISDLENQNK